MQIDIKKNLQKYSDKKNVLFFLNCLNLRNKNI